MTLSMIWWEVFLRLGDSFEDYVQTVQQSTEWDAKISLAKYLP
jgi:hypothetical protein